MPWSPVLDQEKWSDAIKEVSDLHQTTEDNFTDGDWDAVAEKYAQEGGRFKQVVPPDPNERMSTFDTSGTKKISGLMTNDVNTPQGSIEKLAENLEMTKGKAAADFVRFAELANHLPGQQQSPAPVERPRRRQRPAATPQRSPTAPRASFKRHTAIQTAVPETSDSPMEESTMSVMKALFSKQPNTPEPKAPRRKAARRQVVESTPVVSSPKRKKKKRRPVATPPSKRQSSAISECVDAVQEGSDAREVARKLIEQLRR